MKGDSVGHAAERVLALENLELGWSVLIKELVDREETTADTDLNLVLNTLNHDALGAELVDTFAFSHEHDLELLPVWIVVNVLGKLFVDSVVLDGDVDRDARLQIDNVLS